VREALVQDIIVCIQNAGIWTEVVATTVPSDATRLTELFFPPPTIARKEERVGAVGDACGVAAVHEGDDDGVTVADSGKALLHAVSKTTTNINRPINIQNAG
jgi:hypothetical protein